MKEKDIIKITKLDKRYKNKIITIVLWLFIGFLIVRGVGTIIRGNTINLTPFKEEITEKIDKSDKKNQGIAFAENFISEYLNFSGDEREYLKRLSQYSELDFSKTKLKKMDVIYVNRIGAEWKNENLLNVDLKVKIAEIPEMENLNKYVPSLSPSPTPTPAPKKTKKPAKQTPKKKTSELSFDKSKQPELKLMANINSPEPIENEDSEENIVDILYMRVPVLYNKNECKISGYPTFISDPEVEDDDKDNSLPGEILKDDDEIEGVKELVTSFLNSYYEGNKTELLYFMKDKNNIDCLNGEYEITDVPLIEMTKFKDKYYSRIYYQVIYKENILDNGMEFVIVKEDDKFLIENYDTAIN